MTDEGPGIPEEWRERIFEPYARRETQTASGSGIGLYAAKRLAEIDGQPPVERAGAVRRRPVRARDARRGGGLDDDRRVRLRLHDAVFRSAAVDRRPSAIAPVQSLQDLNGKKVGVVTGSTGDDIASRVFGKTSA